MTKAQLATNKTKKNLNIYEKLAAARKYIRDQKPKKNAENTYSNYFYFSPEYVGNMTDEVADMFGCICICDLIKDENGYLQKMRLVNLENLDDFIDFELRTEIGEIKATNITQQFGATDTYSERYVRMKVFGIRDNSLDPDSKDQTIQKAKTNFLKKDEKPVVWFSPKNPSHAKALQACRDQGMDSKEIIKKIREKMGVSTENADRIINGKI